MDTTNGLKMDIKNGTFSINDAITIAFSEATIILPVKSYKLPVGEKIRYMATTNTVFKKKVLKKKQAILPTKQQKGGIGSSPERAAVELAIMDLLKTNKSLKCKEVLPLLIDDHESATQKMIENVFTKLKEKKVIKVIERGVYALDNSKVKSLPAVKKIMAPVKQTALNPTHATEEAGEPHHHYVTSEPILLGDIVEILNAHEAIHEDDILLFEPVAEYSGSSATIVNCDEGSNMVKIKVGKANTILVYPHWIKLMKRA